MKTSSKSKGLFLLSDILFCILLVILDQITKNLAVIYLKDKPPYVIFDGVFELHYLENRGAAFGMLQNQKILFVTIAVVILLIIGYLLLKIMQHLVYHTTVLHECSQLKKHRQLSFLLAQIDERLAH